MEEEGPWKTAVYLTVNLLFCSREAQIPEEVGQPAACMSSVHPRNVKMSTWSGSQDRSGNRSHWPFHCLRVKDYMSLNLESFRCTLAMWLSNPHLVVKNTGAHASQRRGWEWC